MRIPTPGTVALAGACCFGLLAGCREEPVFEPVAAGNAPAKPPPGSCVIRAGGPDCLVPITNAPSANRVHLAPPSLRNGYAYVGFTNHEPRTILVYNVRVQKRSEGKGTDGLGWDTIADDYPDGDPGKNTSRLPPGATGEIRVPAPSVASWRVCLVYSQDWGDTGKNYSGNYEVVGGGNAE